LLLYLVYFIHSSIQTFMQFMKRFFVSVPVAGLVLLAACKKHDVSPNSTTSDTTVTASKGSTNDSALAAARDVYLWYNQIPSSFNVSGYADPKAVMTAIRQYSNEPGFSTPVDRWSFGMKKAEWDNVSSGISGDFGLTAFFRVEGDLRVRSVERVSPAGKAGIHRGWKITKVNGSTDITTSNADYLVKNIYQSATTSFTFQKPDGSTQDITLAATTYQEHPVILDSVYAVGGKNIGYFSFNSFLGDTTEI
jgi:carboxyl-terminal processing protease